MAGSIEITLDNGVEVKAPALNGGTWYFMGIKGPYVYGQERAEIFFNPKDVADLLTAINAVANTAKLRQE